MIVTKRQVERELHAQLLVEADLTDHAPHRCLRGRGVGSRRDSSQDRRRKAGISLVIIVMVCRPCLAAGPACCAAGAAVPLLSAGRPLVGSPFEATISIARSIGICAIPALRSTHP